MDIQAAKKYIRLSRFFPDFCGIPFTPMISHKIRGIDGNRKPISFTKAEKLKIQQGRIKLNKYLQNVLKDPAK